MVTDNINRILLQNRAHYMTHEILRHVAFSSVFGTEFMCLIHYDRPQARFCDFICSGLILDKVQ